MANASVNTNSTYAGELARPYVAAAILSADTIANNYISVLENVHYKAVLRPFSGAAIQANDDCAFTTPSTNALTVGEAVLTASALKVNEQVCNADLRSTWESTQMRGQSSAAPADFTSYVAQYVAAKVAENVEHNIWAGNWKQILDEAAPYASFYGYHPKHRSGRTRPRDCFAPSFSRCNHCDWHWNPFRSRSHHGRRRRRTRDNRRRPEYENFHEPCICSVVLSSSRSNV